MEKDFTLSNQVQINRIIQSLRDDHQLIGVNFDGRNDGSQSIIVDVDSKQGYFLVDEFPSASCHRLATTGESFDLNAELNGIDVNMRDLNIDEITKDKDGILYQIAIPRRITYAQRRESFRARVSGLADVPVDIAVVADEYEDSGVETEGYEAMLADISAEGCRLSVAGQEDCLMGKPDLVLALTIHVPEGDPISVKVTTRHQRFLTRSQLWYIGCRFESSEKEAQMMIERFVIYMQRLESQRKSMFSD